MKILIVGISTRAMCQSAVSAGHEVISLDFFGDRDQPGEVRVIALGRDLDKLLTTEALATAALDFTSDVDAVMVASGLENEPAFFHLIPKKILWLNAHPEAVRLVRDSHFLEATSNETGVSIPRTIRSRERLPHNGLWVVKDQTRSGGQGVQIWDGTTPLFDNCVLQEFVKGVLCSFSFVSDGKSAVPIGMSRQYAGEIALAAPPFVWCGNAVPFVNSKVEAALSSFVRMLVEKSGLAGINGVDFILSDGIPWILEVNPRPGASLDLYEKVCGFNGFQMHMEAIQGKLPGKPVYLPNKAAARGILYARKDVRILDHPRWLSGRYGDIPHPNEIIPAGAPICSIYSESTTALRCWEDILARAHEPYELVFPI